MSQKQGLNFINQLASYIISEQLQLLHAPCFLTFVAVINPYSFLNSKFLFQILVQCELNNECGNFNPIDFTCTSLTTAFKILIYEIVFTRPLLLILQMGIPLVTVCIISTSQRRQRYCCGTYSICTMRHLQQYTYINQKITCQLQIYQVK